MVIEPNPLPYIQTLSLVRRWYQITAADAMTDEHRQLNPAGIRTTAIVLMKDRLY